MFSAAKGTLAIQKSIINPLVPRLQQIKIRNLTFNRLPIVEFVKKMVHLGTHYSERHGTNGLNANSPAI